MGTLFKIDRGGKRSRCYYGKVKVAPGRWRRIALFTDKIARERRLRELQADAERRASGVIDTTADHAVRPIGEHVDAYLEWLRSKTSSPAHHAIVANLLRRIVAAAGWRFARDMTPESVERILVSFGETVSYRNGIVKRAKAFANLLARRGRVRSHPLRELSRASEKGTKRNRARRAATPTQLVALLSLEYLPDNRRLAYALAALNGLRRNEVKSLEWGQLTTAATIPFVALAQKGGEGTDVVPLHPYVARLIGQRTRGMDAVRVLPSVPDVATLKRDLARAGIDFADDRGRRLDYHGLRHTFTSNLDHAGASRATKKRLTRHANDDVTDGYAHAELSEMSATIGRLHSPINPPAEPTTLRATGTLAPTSDAISLRPVGDLTAAKGRAEGDHRRDQAATIPGHSAARAGTMGGVARNLAGGPATVANLAIGTACHAEAPRGLPSVPGVLNMAGPRPDARVD